MAKVFTIINNKGGTGKTTTTLNLGAALAKKRKKVLLIDLDAQSNLTSSVGINNVEKHVGDFMLENSISEEFLIKTQKITLIPSSEKLVEYEHRINNEPGNEFLLTEALEKLKDQFDYIIIDCAPNLGVYSVNSLVAADYYVVPMQAENFAFIGLDKILQVAEKVKKRLNQRLELAGILIVRQAHKTKFSQAVIRNIAMSQELGQKLFNTLIRQDISLMESTAFGKSIFDYAPKSRGAEDYNKFANELIKKYG